MDGMMSTNGHSQVIQYHPDSAVDSEIRRLEKRKLELQKLLALRREVCALELEVVTENVSDANRITDTVEVVTENWPVSEQQLKGRNRDLNYVIDARFAFYSFLRKYCQLSSVKIGRVLGGRDHSTVVHGWHTFEDRMRNEPEYRAKVTAIENKLLERFAQREAKR